MKVTSINFPLTTQIKDNIYHLEDEFKNMLGINTEIKIIIKKETSSQYRVDIQALLNGSVIKSYAIAKRFDFAFRKSKNIFFQNFIKQLKGA